VPYTWHCFSLRGHARESSQRAPQSAVCHYLQGTLERKLDAWSRLTTSNKVQIVVDASLWGIGGILIVGKVIKSYFADGICEDDTKILGVVAAIPHTSKCWKLWQYWWHQERGPMSGRYRERRWRLNRVQSPCSR